MDVLDLRLIATIALMPLAVALTLMVLGQTAGATRRPAVRVYAHALVWAGLVLLWLASTPWVAFQAMHHLERPFPPTAPADCRTGEAIVVLGGGVAPATPHDPIVRVRAAGDRVVMAARLWRAGCAPVVIASGGRRIQRADHGDEATAMAELLVLMGVRDDRIVAEGKSRTTRENARETARLAQDMGIKTVVLVTSAWHMRRAAESFRRAGLEVKPIGADYRGQAAPVGWLAWVPQADALSDTTTAAKELLAGLYYFGFSRARTADLDP